MSAKDWYLRQSNRDRLIVILVGVLLLVSLVWLLVWKPISDGLELRQLEAETNQRVIAELLQGEASVRGGRSAGGVVKQTDKPPYLLVDELIGKHGMRRPERVEPIGNEGARVTFSTVEFDKLMLALTELEEYGLVISTLNVSRKDTGLVAARFRVDKP
ncbi:type II secretion system protein GspM [Granulosicoccaceae sp. 1_MG-2023]|nr:type II secretion system protein GspM [Granulosicoccaceae sp. 1_MG-2023]